MPQMDGIAAIEKIVERHPDTLEEFFSRIYLNLRRPIYKNTACYGHFGSGFKGPWEKVTPASCAEIVLD